MAKEIALTRDESAEVRFEELIEDGHCSQTVQANLLIEEGGAINACRCFEYESAPIKSFSLKHFRLKLLPEPLGKANDVQLLGFKQFITFEGVRAQTRVNKLDYSLICWPRMTRMKNDVVHGFKQHRQLAHHLITVFFRIYERLIQSEKRLNRASVTRKSK